MSKTKRIFVAVNLPQQTKRKLTELQKELGVEFERSAQSWGQRPVRWTSPDNMHLTLLFLGNLSLEQIARLNEIAGASALNIKPFRVKLTRTCYGPAGDQKPRMVWVEIERNKELMDLANRIKDAVYDDPAFDYIKKEKRAFAAHLTLARFSAWQFAKVPLEERPNVERELNLEFGVGSVEVMESRLKRSGAEYQVLQVNELKG